MPGYSAEARRHLVESDIDGVMIADFVSDTPAEYKAYRQLEPDAPESPLAAKILGAGPAGDVWRAHHACRRLPLDERYGAAYTISRIRAPLRSAVCSGSST